VQQSRQDLTRMDMSKWRDLGDTLKQAVARGVGRLPGSAPALKLPELTGLAPGLADLVAHALRRPEAPSDDGDTIGRFLDGVFANAAGSRTYKLFVPAGYPGGGALIVMLHGCTQSPEDFAAGTHMNAAAAARGCVVLYPAQAQSANAQKCWNWFRGSDQVRDSGEPSIIAGMTRQIIEQYRIDPARVFAAGLSAGGAAAAVLGATYPDIFAAIGVHSGLACGAAHDLTTAMAAMAQGRPGRKVTGRRVPVIVFQGDQDHTVNPSNADAVMTQWMPAASLAPAVEDGRVPGGRAWTRTSYRDAHRRVVLEKWLVHGAGHAWSGGRKAGSFTDPAGPDATSAMLRFFLES